MEPVFEIRHERDDEAATILEVVRAAFGAEGAHVAALADALRSRAAGGDGLSLVAVAGDGTVLGHVQLSRCWVDDDRRPVAGLTLSPLSVRPDHQGRGIGGALVAAAVGAADDAGEPFVMLEGDPGLYGRWGFVPAASHRLTPPSVRVPAPACQVVTLRSWDTTVSGALVYNDVFWRRDAVGLRGEDLDQVRAALGE